MAHGRPVLEASQQQALAWVEQLGRLDEVLMPMMFQDDGVKKERERRERKKRRERSEPKSHLAFVCWVLRVVHKNKPVAAIQNSRPAVLEARVTRSIPQFYGG